MKRFFTILLILILFGINTISVKASSTAVLPFDNAIALYDFSNGLQNGLTYDMSKYSDYATWQEAEEAFYRDILNYLAQVNWGGEYNADQLYNSYYTLDYGMTNSIANDFTKKYNDYVLDPTNGFAIPLGKDVTASWNRFNDFYIKKYLDAVNADIDSHPTNPDPNYNSILDSINGSGFYFKTFPNVNGFSDTGLKVYPASLCSWYSINGWNSTIGSICYCWSYDILDININSVNDLYNFNINLQNPITNFHITGDSYNKYGVVNNGVGGYYGFDSMGSDALPSDINYTGTLSEIMNYIQSRFKNVNIYVDGVLWSYVGAIDQPFITAPDVIFGENDEMLDNDIPIPNTDGYFDYIALQNLIHEAIENADIIGWDTLIENGIVIDGEGEALQESDFTKDSIRDIDDDETDDLPLENIIPPPPPPPPLFQDWKFSEINPDEDPRPRAISVLARIVNVTNKSLPSDVMAMFWGICITLLILGLIKIMHK